MVGRTRRDVYRVALLLGLVLFATTTPALATSAGTGSTDGDTIHRTVSLSLTPDTPGEIAATATFDIPRDVRTLETTLPADATVTDTRGFTKQDDRTYAWDESTADPSIRFTVPANESRDGVRAGNESMFGVRAATHQSGRYSFVDTGPWAIVTVPQLGTRWRYVGDRITLEKSVSVDGEGATGGQIAYLGPSRTVERSAHGQTFELVIPDAATLEAEPADILDATVSASDTLRVGGRDEHVFMVAAPTTIQWTAAGIEYGGSDYWVQADERLSEPRNVWLHEYVHTRQDYDPATGAKWTVEAGAEYYAALLTLQQERIGFPAFRRHLERGTRESAADAVLSEPSTWSSGTPYLKGALVYGNVDRRIRLDSNRTSSMQAVLSRMNADPDQVTADEFYAAVETAGDTTTREYAERYAGTNDVPSVWTASEHEAAFASLPARVAYRTTALTISGPVRDTASFGADTVVTTRETVTATVEVTNSGGANGTYETVMYVDNQTAATSSGTIEPDTTETVTLSHSFDRPGTYSLQVGDTTRTVVVKRPAQPQVTELQVNASRSDGAWIATIAVTLTNPATWPASGSVPVTVDGSTVATIDTDLAANETTTRTITTELAPGTHTIATGNTSTTLDVPTTTPPTETPVPTPGPGPVLAGIVLLSTILAVRRTQR